MKILTTLAILVCFNLSAQQNENTSFHQFNMLFYNPAYAGSRNTVNMVAVSRFQYVKTDGRPATQWFSAHAPIAKRRLGIGLHVNRDAIGVREKTLAKLDISTSLKLNAKTRLNFGLTPGVSSTGADYSKLTKYDQNDPIANQSFNQNAFEFGAGMFLFSEKGYIGLSIPNFLKQSSNVLSPVNHAYLTMGRVFKINPSVDLKPFGLVKYAVGAPIAIDLNLNVIYNKTFWLGAMMRPSDGFGFSFNHTLFNKFTYGYSYEHTYFNNRNWKTHEIVLMFDISKNQNSMNYSPRYF